MLLGLGGWAVADALAGESDPTADALLDGFDGQVNTEISAPRSRATSGLCEAGVRDTSSSVAVDIDPDGQINAELAGVMGALGSANSARDVGSIVVFSDTATTEGPHPVGDPQLAAAISRSASAGSTNFEAAFAAALSLLDQCPAGAVRHITMTTDGVGGVDLSVIPDDVRVDVIAVNGSEGWASVSNEWSHPNVFVHPIEELLGGSVATTYGQILYELTGHNVTVTVTN